MASEQTEQGFTAEQIASAAIFRLASLAQLSDGPALDAAQLTQVVSLLADTVLALVVAGAEPPTAVADDADSAAHAGLYL